MGRKCSFLLTPFISDRKCRGLKSIKFRRTDKMNKYISLLISCLLSFVLVVPALSSPGSEDASNKVIVEIDYGKELPTRTVEVSLNVGQTVLDALQRIAAVETHPVGQHVIVSAIDGVEGKRGETAWYYTIDGISAERLAVANVIDKAVHITWTYQKDICSWKVDK